MNGKEYDDWLASLEVGSKVAAMHSYYGSLSYEIVEVERITKTGQLHVSGYSNNFKNGRELRERGDKLVPITEDIKESIKRRALLNGLNKLKLDELNTEKLEKIYAIVEGE